MRILSLLILLLIIYTLQSCSSTKRTTEKRGVINEKEVVLHTSTHKSDIPARTINTKNVSADELVTFAETLTGIKYKYGSAIKEQGFDCSGFITYVFNHFNIQVPRSSVQFTNAGTTIKPEETKKGDLILFTGSDTTGWTVGHMGIVTENKQGRISFIHAASGNNKGVMISGMSSYFITRFVKIIRVFN